MYQLLGRYDLLVAEVWHPHLDQHFQSFYVRQAVRQQRNTRAVLRHPGTHHAPVGRRHQVPFGAVLGTQQAVSAVSPILVLQRLGRLPHARWALVWREPIHAVDPIDKGPHSRSRSTNHLWWPRAARCSLSLVLRRGNFHWIRAAGPTLFRTGLHQPHPWGSSLCRCAAAHPYFQPVVLRTHKQHAHLLSRLTDMQRHAQHTLLHKTAQPTTRPTDQPRHAHAQQTHRELAATNRAHSLAGLVRKRSLTAKSKKVIPYAPETNGDPDKAFLRHSTAKALPP